MYNIMDKCPVGFIVWEKDPSGKTEDMNLIYANEAADTMAGEPVTIHIGKHLKDAFPLLLGTPLYDNYKKAMFDREASNIYMLPYPHPNNMLEYYDVHIFPIETYCMAVSYINKTKEFSVAKELEESNEWLNNFAYYVSHDLREPLRTISGMLALLRIDLAEKDLSDKAEIYMSLIEEASLRLGGLIRETLSYAKLGTRNRSEGRTDLSTLIEEVFRDLGEMAKDNNIILKKSSQKEANVGASYTEVYTVLQNLISNAIKYSKDSEVNVNVTKNKGGAFELRVIDHGRGIPEEFQEKIFEPFFRHNGIKLSVSDGFGLGLSSVKRVLSRIGGTVKVEASSEKGTTVLVIIPEFKV